MSGAEIARSTALDMRILETAACIIDIVEHRGALQPVDSEGYVHPTVESPAYRYTVSPAIKADMPREGSELKISTVPKVPADQHEFLWLELSEESIAGRHHVQGQVMNGSRVSEFGGVLEELPHHVKLRISAFLGKRAVAIPAMLPAFRERAARQGMQPSGDPF